VNNLHDTVNYLHDAVMVWPIYMESIDMEFYNAVFEIVMERLQFT
jgi:hypothetical protein